MKNKLFTLILTVFSVVFMFSGCKWLEELFSDEPKKEDYAINMNTSFAECDSLEHGGGRDAKVILLLGQSNATGISSVEYLKENITDEQFEKYEAGFDNVKINYVLDNHSATSDGEFLPVDLTCGAGEGLFGPEVGMAEVLSEAFPDEEIFILKFTMSGTILGKQWLFDGERAWIYDALIAFTEKYMDALIENNYNAKIGAVCWMQGESDTDEKNAVRYYENQCKFVEYLRSDLSKYADGEIYFVDAGISDSPCWAPGYITVNEAKRRFAELSPYNIYFDTVEMGLTALHEPKDDPDIAHYDSLSELELGRSFGEEIVKVYNK